MELLDPYALMNWLSLRGMTFVREEYDKALGAPERRAAKDRMWYEAMPRSLQIFFEDMQRTGLSSRSDWTTAVAQEFPDPVLRAGALSDCITGMIDELAFDRDSIERLAPRSPRELRCFG